MAQRSIEILIGRLITDEVFRSAFRTNATTTLTGFVESGYELTSLEITGVRATPADLWERVAEYIDPRLQRVSLRAAKATVQRTDPQTMPLMRRPNDSEEES